VLIGLVVLLVAGAFLISEIRLSREYPVSPVSLALPNSEAALARGSYLTSALVGCRDCHGFDLGGAEFIVDPAIGMIYGPNLTSGRGGIGAVYNDEDWVRAIRHGIGRDNQGLLGIPAGEYMNFTEEDLAAVITVLKSLPPVDREMPASQVGPVGRILMVVGAFPPPSAAVIDHEQPFPDPVPPGGTPEYGEYLASLGCMGCHREDLTGGVIPGTPPEWPPAPDLTQAGKLGNWSEAEFIQSMRTGITPEGTMNPNYMPWTVFTNLSDEDLKALWAFLQNLPDDK
jgi:cytochrome c553